MEYGYARVSTKEQNELRQLIAKQIFLVPNVFNVYKLLQPLDIVVIPDANVLVKGKNYPAPKGNQQFHLIRIKMRCQNRTCVVYPICICE